MGNHFVNIAEILIDAFFKILAACFVQMAGGSLQNGHLFFEAGYFFLRCLCRFPQGSRFLAKLFVVFQQLLLHAAELLQFTGELLKIGGGILWHGNEDNAL